MSLARQNRSLSIIVTINLLKLSNNATSNWCCRPANEFVIMSCLRLLHVGFPTFNVTYCMSGSRRVDTAFQKLRTYQVTQTFATVSSTSSALTPPATPTGLLSVVGVLSVTFRVFVDTASCY